MAAANTDKLRKSKSNFSTTLSSSITDSDTTIPLSSTTGLPTDTAITITIDRVDANGNSLTTTERVIGVISGNNLTNAVRANDNTTAQAHSSGAVVECVWDADSLNDMIDAVLAEHGQDGTHNADAIDAITEIAAALKSGADATLVTGTAGTDTYVPKWNADGDIVDGYAFLDEDDMATNSATAVPSQQSVKAYVDAVSSDVVNDTTPQLGGDLDLNGHNIDFPTTANISDCLDEDDMSSNSATKLATQQSIKAYADTKLLDADGDVALLKGWSFLLGDGDDTASGAASFGDTFSSRPVVVITALGVKSGSDPSHIGDFTAAPFAASVGAISTSGFTAVITNVAGTTYDATKRLGYSWIAIGTLE